MKLRVFIVAGLGLALATGCASSSQAPAEGESGPVIKASAIAQPPVGAVIPVFVTLACERDCGDWWKSGPEVVSDDIYALSGSGEYVQALKLDDAVKAAGSAQKLTAQLTTRTDSEVLQQWWEENKLKAGDPFLLVVVVPLVLAYRSYLAGDQEALQRENLRQIAFYKRDHGKGWVFFPSGNYTEVKILTHEYGPAGLLSKTLVPLGELKLPLGHATERGK